MTAKTLQIDTQVHPTKFLFLRNSYLDLNLNFFFHKALLVFNTLCKVSYIGEYFCNDWLLFSSINHLLS